MIMSISESSIALHTELPKEVLEEGTVFAPAFDRDGLIPAIAVHAETGEILMFAWMNSVSLRRTVDEGEAWYWSRSRSELWHKGATSGQVQKVVEIRTDCDQDVIQVRVIPEREGACHVGYRSCFYRSVKRDNDGGVLLTFEETAKVQE